MQHYFVDILLKLMKIIGMQMRKKSVAVCKEKNSTTTSFTDFFCKRVLFFTKLVTRTSYSRNELDLSIRHVGDPGAQLVRVQGV